MGVNPPCSVLQKMPSGNLLGRILLIVRCGLAGNVRVFRVYIDVGPGGMRLSMNARVVT